MYRSGTRYLPVPISMSMSQIDVEELISEIRLKDITEILIS